MYDIVRSIKVIVAKICALEDARSDNVLDQHWDYAYYIIHKVYVIVKAQLPGIYGIKPTKSEDIAQGRG